VQIKWPALTFWDEGSNGLNVVLCQELDGKTASTREGMPILTATVLKITPHRTDREPTMWKFS